MKSVKHLILLTTLFISIPIFANTDIIGKWRSIDDKTGFSKAIIEIKKNEQNIYTGTIIAVTPRPGYTPKEICDQCKGEFKNKPIIGLQILNNMKRSTSKPDEFTHGTILDPLSGNQYKTTLRLNPTGSRLSIRGYIGIEVLGRNQTWLRMDE